jgi:aryl-alcohol dehydrogenase-like predicted oxidoreductase
MSKRQLGTSALHVAPLAFGGNVFGWTVDEPTSFQLLDAFVAEGFNLIDTADSYSRWVPGHKGGESESIIGRWVQSRGNREQVIIATKVGSDMGQGKKDLSKSWILREAEESLRRLHTDYIDLYQSHWDDSTTPVEETLEAYDRLVKDGKVRVIGASNLSAQRLRESLETSKRKGYPRYESLQPNYNLYDRAEFENELEPICRDENLGVIPYFSLASGFLTGKYRSEADLANRARGAFVKKYLNERGLRILDALDVVAAEHNAKAAQIAIAWLLSRPAVIAPIASATSLDQLQQLVQATRLQLRKQDLDKLDLASAP